MEGKQQNGRPLIVVGMCGSGKSAVAEYLREQGCTVIRFGQITIDELQRRGMPISPENERVVREEIRARQGMDAYARTLLSKIEAALNAGRLVIDGLYSWSEYKYLKQRLPRDPLVVAVFCPRHLRYRRLAERSERPLTAEEAEKRDIAELEALDKGGPIAMADYMLLNDGSMNDLRNLIDKLLRAVNRLEGALR